MTPAARRSLLAVAIAVVVLTGAILIYGALAGLGVSLAEWFSELRPTPSGSDSPGLVYLIVGVMVGMTLSGGDRKVTLSYEDRRAIEACARATAQVADAIDRLTRGAH